MAKPPIPPKPNLNKTNKIVPPAPPAPPVMKMNSNKIHITKGRGRSVSAPQKNSSVMDELSKKLQKRGKAAYVLEGTGKVAEPKPEVPKPKIQQAVKPIVMTTPGTPPPPPPAPPVMKMNSNKISIPTIKKSKSLELNNQKQSKAAFVGELKNKLANRKLSGSVVDIEKMIKSNKEAANNVDFSSVLKRSSKSQRSINNATKDNSSELERAFSKMKQKRRDSGIDLTK
ncbi:MAG: hypothetical protein J6Y29_01140 [Clostridiales bacterium]|nr:hypothetical protein [Clostridiales bacterium]